MDNLLYYPYINIPKSNWSARALLYYDQIGSIVPESYFWDPDSYDPFMREMVQAGLVIPINPMQVLDHPWEISRPFIDYIKGDEFDLGNRVRTFREGGFRQVNKNKFPVSGSRIHANKFDGEIFYQLQEMGLARQEGNQWYNVEYKTSKELMTFLASVIGNKLNYRPTTDEYKKRFSLAEKSKSIFKTLKKEEIKREIILNELIPFPEEIDLSKLQSFKEKHRDLLRLFRTKIENLALNPNLDEDSALFKESINELSILKNEVAVRMAEKKFGKIYLGTICSITSSAISAITSDSNVAVIGGFLGLVGAIHSALQIENAGKIVDQSGMKYLALIDKRVRTVR